MDPSLKILFVPRWYPSRTDPMPGLFIQRQAEALALKHSVQVISVHPDHACKSPFEIVHSVENHVNACRVYYKSNSGKPFISALVNIFRYVKAHHLGYHSILPYSADIIHGHILTREIFFAWFMSRKQNCPFIISEHWSRYFPTNGTYTGFLRKWMTRFFLKKSSALIAVSESLSEAMKACGLQHSRTYIVPNVVDTSSFVVAKGQPISEKAVILHVSCFDDKSKNISGFLDAVKELYKHRNDFRVILVGDGPDFKAMCRYADRLGLNAGKVEFAGLKQDNEIIRIYQSCSFLVQSSRYETFGTVVVEALASGLPVVSTSTGIAASLINHTNGILIQHSTVGEIVRAIDHMLNIYSTFEKQKLHESVALTFSGNIIGEHLGCIYREITATWQMD